ncbi:hypothetical protein BCR44DRAFT_1444848, partial [Catenaria anguillulae PL171]
RWGVGHGATAAATVAAGPSPPAMPTNPNQQSKARPVGTHHRPSAKVFVGRTFKLLTLMLTIYWICFLVFIALYRPFPIYSTAITTTLCALATAAEAAFDWLINYNRGLGPTMDEDDTGAAHGHNGLSRRVSLRAKFEQKIMVKNRTWLLSAGGGDLESQQHSGGHAISGASGAAL